MQPDTETPLFDETVSDIDKADLCERLARIEHTQAQHGVALNQIGEMLQYMVQTVGGIAQQFQGKSLPSILKGMFGNGG